MIFILITGTNLFSSSVQFSSVQLLSHVRFFATPWTAANQASLFVTNSWSLPKLMSIDSVMPSNHLILCHPLLLPPSIFPSIRLFPPQWLANVSETYNKRPKIYVELWKSSFPGIRKLFNAKKVNYLQMTPPLWQKVKN